MDAVAYIRWSTEDQSKGNSEKRQTELAHSLCDQEGWDLVELIVESGKSAFHGVNRAAGGKLAALEKRAARGELIGYVLIVENLDRLSRQEPLESLTLLQSLTQAGLTIAESSSGQKYTSEAIKENWQHLLVAFIRAGLAYDESYKKSGRIKAAWAVARERKTTKDGKADSRYCPGWMRVTDGKYEIIENRASTIRRIFQMSVDGIGVNRIARLLNDEPLTRWQRGPWSSSNLSTLLRGRQVLGEYLPHELVGEGKRAPIGDWTKICPPIVSEELWHRVQMGLDQRRSAGGKSTGFANVLRGMIHCGKCMSSMTLASGWNKEDKTQKGLVCSSYHRGQGCTNKRRLHYNPLLAGVLDNLLKFAVPEPVQTDMARQSIAVAEAELRAAEKRLDTLADGFAETGSHAMMRAIQRSETDIEQRKADLARLRRAVEAQGAKRPVSAIAGEVSKLRDNMSNDQTRMAVNGMLREVIDGMWYHPDIEETHVLVAGVHAFRFGPKGRMLGQAIATSALIDEAGRRGAAIGSETKAQMAMEKWEGRH